MKPPDTHTILWLDDDPFRTERFHAALPDAKTVETAIEMIDLLAALDVARPARAVFLDHDLGGRVLVDPARSDTGMAVIRWVEAHRPPVALFVVHSFNPETSGVMVERLREAGYEAQRAPFGSAAFLEVLEALAFDD